MIKDGQFTTDHKNVLFTIELNACEGGITFDIKVVEGKSNPSFHEIIGALEYMKMHIVSCQREGNIELIKKIKSEKTNESSDSSKEGVSTEKN